MEEFVRSEMLLGKESIEKLASSHVAVFGLGGVGGYVVEGLVRSGIGYIDIFDNDVVSRSNINRQIIATSKTIGMKKIDVMRERILSINPNCVVNTNDMFVLSNNIKDIDFTKYDYVIDAIDTITGKIAIIEECNKHLVPIISSMGTGNKLNPNMFEIVDIYQTSVCPLAKVIRRELKKRNIKSLKVLYSKEEPIKCNNNYDEDSKKIIPGSVSFVPSVAGLIIASEVIKDLIKNV